MAWQEEGGANAGLGQNQTNEDHWLGTRNAVSLIIRTENGLTATPNDAAEVMRFTPAAQGRRVGIGTENPTQKLELGSGNLRLRGADANGGAIGGIHGNLYLGGTTDTGELGMRLFGGRVNPGPGEIHAGFVDVRTDNAGDGLRIRVDTGVGGTERMRITAGGNVGIGTTTPQARLSVVNEAGVGVSGRGTQIIVGPGLTLPGHGVAGRSDSDSGVHGTSANGPGVSGISGNGPGVFGSANPNGPGVSGFSPNEDQPGVFGHGTVAPGISGFSEGGATFDAGVLGFSENRNGVYGLTINGFGGVRGEGRNPGVFGVSTFSGATSGVSGTGPFIGVSGFGEIGVSGGAAGGGFAGVFGTASGMGTVAGVLGQGASTGVRGESPSGIGVRGQTQTAIGVAGVSDTTGTGVLGQSFGSGVGVMGTGAPFSGTGPAGRFIGNVEVIGQLSSLGKPFKIDHPLDPANKYLLHSSVESSEMKNVYDGVVALREDGTARVELPDWFKALNKDFRYQLTAVGGAAPDLHIAAELSEENGYFDIAGGEAGMMICWQVTGVRQDAWAEANRIAVEQEKPGQERGRYLHPEPHYQTAEQQGQPRPELAFEPPSLEPIVDSDREEQVRQLNQQVQQELEQQQQQSIQAPTFDPTRLQEAARRMRELDEMARREEEPGSPGP